MTPSPARAICVRHHRTLTALRMRTCSSLCKRLETAAAWFLFCNSQLQPLLPLELKGFAAFRVIYKVSALYPSKSLLTL